jgi:hypothetical protein
MEDQDAVLMKGSFDARPRVIIQMCEVHVVNLGDEAGRDLLNPHMPLSPQIGRQAATRPLRAANLPCPV